ncbi:hypothetical protein ACFVZ3_33880 [Kitasatospora purpeofusca]|uniref:hypothetical protein n=1 Tax=Kitasatospora purpeofusca TaxID=67352 RepID=UPI0036CEBB05
MSAPDMPADVDRLLRATAKDYKHGRGPFLLSVFAATSWRGELTNAEPDKHLAVLWMDTSALPTPMFPTSHVALTAYLAGDGRGFSTYGWDASEDLRALVGA